MGLRYLWGQEELMGLGDTYGAEELVGPGGTCGAAAESLRRPISVPCHACSVSRVLCVIHALHVVSRVVSRVL